MAEINVEREPGRRGEAPRSLWPIWLAGALGVAGLLAVLPLAAAPTTTAERSGVGSDLPLQPIAR